MKQKEYFNLNELSNILDKNRPSNIFLVTGGRSYELCGAKEKIEPILQGYKTIIFSDFTPNPKIKDIEKGIKIFRENNCDFVIAVGGGSAIDTAKSVNILSAQDGNPEDYVKGKEIENKNHTLVAIPTTAGSGSEATHFAVVYIDKEKYSLAHEFILPDYAIVDYRLTKSLPKNQTASTGMDALSQAIESYWCVYSNDESKTYAKEAINLSIKYLRDAVNNPTDKSREAMAKAAHLAGKAINISKTTASHAISYPITSYFGIAHGHAVVLTLGEMLVYNSNVTEQDCLDKRGADYVRTTINEIVELLSATSAEEASKKITTLMKYINLTTTLKESGIKTEEDIALIIKHGFNPGRVKNNPRLLTEESLRKILQEIY